MESWFQNLLVPSELLLYAQLRRLYLENWTSKAAANAGHRNSKATCETAAAGKAGFVASGFVILSLEILEVIFIALFYGLMLWFK